MRRCTIPQPETIVKRPKDGLKNPELIRFRLDWQSVPTQAAKQQAQQQQLLAQQLRKEINKSSPQQRIYPQPPTPAQKLPTPTAPMTNGYDERDKDELVIHSRAQQPFKTMSQTKSALTGQKSGF